MPACFHCFAIAFWQLLNTRICYVMLWKAQDGQYTSPCQILWRFKPLLRYGDFSIFPRWRPSAILDLWCVFGHPRRAFGGLCHCAKCGWNRYSSFDNNMQVLIFCESGLKTPIHAPKNWWGSSRKGGTESPSNTMSTGPRPTSVPSGMPELGCCPLSVWELHPHLTQRGVGLGRGLPAYQVASWSLQPFGHSRHRPKSRGLLCLFRGEAGSLTRCRMGRGMSCVRYTQSDLVVGRECSSTVQMSIGV